ncbi:MAG: tRNA uridine-5-carboxymethylaminomethyl(34) synthesis GTPase MnmE, partial [Lachnospiraceae bacterium]|nr:tRNA uridine-5-carboxymethylaminomethyl(34) synthesis GTPase MnmE [Lachnospiraceae bacterium]
ENVGIDEFVKAVKEMFYNGEIDFNNQVFITNARQKAALYSASESLKRTADSIENELSEDFYTIDMMDAYESLGQVIGEAIEDDLADEIFSKFCMGK